MGQKKKQGAKYKLNKLTDETLLKSSFKTVLYMARRYSTDRHIKDFLSNSIIGYGGREYHENNEKVLNTLSDNGIYLYDTRVDNRNQQTILRFSLFDLNSTMKLKTLEQKIEKIIELTEYRFEVVILCRSIERAKVIERDIIRKLPWFGTKAESITVLKSVGDIKRGKTVIKDYCPNIDDLFSANARKKNDRVREIPLLTAEKNYKVDENATDDDLI